MMTTTEPLLIPSNAAIRLDPRLACDFDAILTEGEERRRVRVVDVSRSGALVEVSPLPDLGQAIRLQVLLPVASQPLIADAVVVRHLAYECGVRFSNLAPEARGTLEKYLFARTCQFGWLSTRRLFSSLRQLAGTSIVTLLAALVCLFGGRQLALNATLPQAIDPAWLDLALVLVAMAPPALILTLGYGLHLAPPEVRDVLLFGSDPLAMLQKNLDAVRRSFGLSRKESESLVDLHLADWHLPAMRVRVFLRLLFVFALFYALLCSLATR